MRLLNRAGRDVSIRTFGPDTSVAPGPLDIGSQRVDASPVQSIGLPAVMAAVRLVADSIAAMPVKVYDRAGALDRQLADTTQQYRLLHHSPNLEQSAFEFIQDVVASVECFGNAFVLKTIAQGQVRELRVLSASRVTVKADAKGQVTFEIQDGPDTKTLTSREILHVRGLAPFGGASGVSPLTLHRGTLGNNVALASFAGRYFANDATPGLVLKMPQNLNTQQAEEIGNQWNQAHRGLVNARKTAVLGGGADIQVLPVSMVDAQFAESAKLGIEDVARIFGVPAELITGAPVADPQKTAEHFLKFCLAPRLRRIEAAFARDTDLFPEQLTLYPEFNADALLRPATRERYEAYRAARQAGWLSPNEIRALENYPPTPGGEEIQMTPVGGAPNPSNA